ncbi:MAG: TlpA disulfide reductase family protein [Bacteroidota bacterium]
MPNRLYRLPLYLLLILPLFQSACFVMQDPYTSVAPGIWRGNLQLEAQKIALDEDGKPINPSLDEIIPGRLPFHFEVIYDNETDFHIEIINAEERIRIDDIQLFRSRSTAKDTMIINIPIYESFIKAGYTANVISGYWEVTTRDNYRVPFVARQGKKDRFTTLKETPIMDISGAWESTFGTDGDDPYKAIGEFKQKDNHLTGTFLTETGDYRFLEGTVQGNKFYLSCFDGAHAFLFEGKILEDSSLIGSFRSGTHYLTTWEAQRNLDFKLADPDTLTRVASENQTFNFAFENTEGKMVSLDDPQYQNKVKIIQILGTWCPNCRDETRFLTKYLKENPNDQLAVIGLAFEKHRDKTKAKKAIQIYKEKAEIPYEVLLAGYYNKKEAAQSLPMLNHVLSYPTMIFLDRDNNVKRIHTGFSGPATSKYKPFTRDFKAYVKTLVEEGT